MTLTPIVQEVIFVGIMETSGKKEAIIGKSEYYDGETFTNELYTNVLTRKIVYGTESKASSVHTTMDGGIYVAGYIDHSDGTHGGKDCMILRLNYTMDIIYIKTFGSSDDEECTSV